MALANRTLTNAYRVPIAAIYAGRRSADKPQNRAFSVLVVRGDGGIGDTILFLSSLRALRLHYPNSRLSLLVGSESADIARTFAGVDEVLSFDVRKYRLDPSYRIRLIRELRSRSFDVALNPIFSREPLTDELLYCSGAKERIAFDGNLDNISARMKAKNNAFCTRILGPRPGLATEIERNREFVEKLTGRRPTAEESLPNITVPADRLSRAKHRLLEEGIDADTEPFIVLFPGGSNEIKMWPTDRFADLANRIYGRHKTKIVVCGALSDVSTQESVASQVSAPVVRLAGKTDILELIAILKLSALYIGNDTGPLHLAAAVGTPTLCILGGGHFGRFYPYGDPLKHRAVFHKMDCYQCNWICPYEVSHCIHDVSVDDAWKVATQMCAAICSPACLPGPVLGVSEVRS